MQDEQGNERRTGGEGTRSPENSELLRKCVQIYRNVTTSQPRKREEVVDHVT